MTRLNQRIKDHIIDKAVEKSGIGKEKDAHQQALYKLTEDIRIESLGGVESAKNVEKIARQMQKLHDQLPTIMRSSQFRPVRRDYEMHRLNLGGRRVTLRYGETTEERRFCPSGFTLQGDHPLVVEFDRLIGVEQDIDKRIEDIRSQVRASLSKFTTVKKLLESWPEVKELLPDQLEEVRPQLPAIQVADLNALIGLPSE